MNTQDAAICDARILSPPANAGADVWRVLFVGVDLLWLGQIKRDIACLYPSWLCWAASGLKVGPVNSEWQSANAVIVEGAASGAREWLEKVRAERPDLPCLIRCDLTARQVTDVWKGLNCPMVSSQSDAATLASSLLRNVRLQEWMTDPAMKRLLPQIRKLPATPRLYAQVTDELRSPSSSLDVIAQLIRQDPVMSAKMLQMVNSAFFASSREVTDMMDAALILGTERIKSLVLLAGIFSQYDQAQVCPAIDVILAHSIKVGAYARAIALSETKSSTEAEAAFTAGILHDVGKLILAGNLPDRYKQIRVLCTTKRIPSLAAEIEVFGATHAQIGACLLATWGLPLPILEAVAWHHDPERAGESSFSLLTAVHAANAFAHGTDEMSTNLCQPYFEKLGLSGCCQQWVEMFDLAEADAA